MNKRLKALRQNMNMTQEQFAKNLGITSSLLSQYENDIIFIPESIIDKICSLFFVDKLWLVYGVVKESPLSQIKRNAIAIIASIDDNLFNHLLQNLLSFIELDMENNIEKKVLSYQKELEAEKKGQTYTVLLNINDQKANKYYHPQVFITWG